MITSIGPPHLDPRWDDLVPYPMPEGYDDGYTHYDMEGNGCSLRFWAWLFSDHRRRIVQQDHVGDYFVSTVWIGLDHGFMSGRVLIFETMVFKDESSEDLECRRYATWLEAAFGHAEILNEVRLLAAVKGDE